MLADQFGERGHRHVATAVQGQVEGALGFDHGPGRGVLEHGDPCRGARIAQSGLHRHHRLGRRRQPVRRRQARADTRLQAQPLQAGTGQDDGVVLSGIQFGQAGVDVAAQVAQLQVRAACAQLRLAAQRGGADHRAGRQRIDAVKIVADEGVGRIGALQHRRQAEARLQLHRHVLERVHGAVGLTALHCQLQLLQEQALAADGRQRAVQLLVATGAHRHQHHLQSGMGRAQAGGDMFALPQGERALAGGDAQGFHPPIIRDRGRRRRSRPTQGPG